MSIFFSADKRWVCWMILGFAFVIDFTALKTYVQWSPLARISPTRISPIYTTHAVVPDYQNPMIFPWREFYDTKGAMLYPELNTTQGMYGAFYYYTSVGRFFRPWSIYEPRPKAYKDLFPDIEIQQYLKANPRTIFFAEYAFDSRYLRMPDILGLNIASRVVLVDNDGSNNVFLKKAERVSLSPENDEEEFYNTSLDLGKAKIRQGGAGWEYSVDLPQDFPFYLSTTVFTNDISSWKLMLGNRLLQPMQGTLTEPYSYDVQNIQEKKLTVLLPAEQAPREDLKLQVKLPDRVLNVFQNTYDDLGLDFQTPKAGWLVFNYPYDEKWELSIDGRKTPISKVNRYFIGAPITGGTHQIILRYWPHTSLRCWILISMMLSVICFFWIMFYSIKQEPLL